MVTACLATVLASGCTSGEPGPGGVVEWRELTIDLPADWVEINRTESSLTVANSPGSTEPGQRGDQQVATQFRIDPDTGLADDREFVAEQGGEILREGETTVGGAPARFLEYRFTTGDVPLRERVIVVPSRDLELLQQPTPMQGETGGPQWFLDHVDEFQALLDGVTFGAPEDYLEDR